MAEATQENQTMINVKDFGAAGDGKTDDTPALKAAVNALTQGGTLLFPIGTYLISSSVSFEKNQITICGEGNASQIVYTYEQQEEDTIYDASLFVFPSGHSQITIKDLALQYTGTFFPNVEDSYKGVVNGICIAACTDVRIRRVEVQGFNSSGISILTGDPDRYAERVQVHQCYTHHNRVAGVMFGYVKNMSIIDCDMDYNGSTLAGATGYGCAGAMRELPLNVQIIGNRASYNSRKGIDLHAGMQSVISNNICHGNLLYGIYVEGRDTGNTIIKNNIVSGMDRDKPAFPPPYTWITGISFGTYSIPTVSHGGHHFIVEGNQILDFGMKEGKAYPFLTYFNFTQGKVQIKNNIIKGTRVTHLVVMPCRTNEQKDVMIDISGNQATLDEVVDYTMLITNGSQVQISQNQIQSNQTAHTDGLISLSTRSLETLTMMGNQFTDPSLTSSFALKGFSDDQDLQSKSYLAGNFLNGKIETEK